MRGYIALVVTDTLNMTPAPQALLRELRHVTKGPFLKWVTALKCGRNRPGWTPAHGGHAPEAAPQMVTGPDAFLEQVSKTSGPLIIPKGEKCKGCHLSEDP